MSRIIFHCGAHKTGTSAFQIWLQENRDALYRSGFLLPKSGYNNLGNYVPLAQALIAYLIEPPRREILLNSLRRDSQLHPDHDMIISAEFLSGEVAVGDNGGNLNYETLARNLDELGRKRIVVLVVRDQGSWINSGYAQRRKMLLEVPKFEDFVQRRIDRAHGDWLLQSQAFERHGFEFYGLPYSPDFKKRGVVQGILALPLFESVRKLGVKQKPQRANDSLGAQGLILADVVRSRALEIVPRLSKPARRHLSQLIIGHAERRLPSSRFNGLTGELTNRIDEAYGASNCEFAKRHLGRDWEEVFPRSGRVPDLSPRTISDLSRSEARLIDALASKIIKHSNSKGLFSLEQSAFS